MTTQPPPGAAIEAEDSMLVNRAQLGEGEVGRSARIPLTTTVFWIGAILIDGKFEA